MYDGEQQASDAAAALWSKSKGPGAVLSQAEAEETQRQLQVGMGTCRACLMLSNPESAGVSARFLGQCA